MEELDGVPRSLSISSPTTSHPSRDASPSSTIPSFRSSGDVKLIRHDPPVKPQTDTSDYSIIELSTGLRCLLISNSEADISACSVSVAAGSFQCLDHPGLAHFVEHLVFMGTSEYEEEDFFDTYVVSRGGMVNASTLEEFTTYFFEVNCSGLKGSLKRFSSLFSCALLKDECLERERKAVQSEFEQTRTRHSVRRLYVMKEAAGVESHPWTRHFSFGNAKTLESLSSEDLRLFYETFYTANRMTVVIYGKEELDVLEQWATDFFGRIPNREKGSSGGDRPISSPVSAARPGQLEFPLVSGPRFLIQMAPLAEKRSLNIRFGMKYRDRDYQKSQCYLLAAIIGHESAGSLFHYLKKRGHATTLHADCDESFDGWALFGVHIGLTELGDEEWSDVLVAFFQYIDLLRRASSETREIVRLYEEYKKITSLVFDFRDEPDPAQYCEDLAPILSYAQPIHVLRECNSDMFGFDEDVFRSMLAAMKVDEAVVLRVSPRYEGCTDMTEKWFGGEYTVSPIEEELLERCRSASSASVIDELVLPSPNPFIPEEVCLRSLSAEEEAWDIPKEVVTSEMVRGFYKPNTQFRRPNSGYVMQFRFLLPLSSAKNRFMMELLVKLIHDSLNETLYFAEEVGVQYSFRGGRCGVWLRSIGYSGSVHVLIGLFVKRLFHSPERFLLEERFCVLRKEMIKKLKNKRRQDVSSLAESYFGWCIDASPSYFWFEDILIAGKRVTFEDLCLFARFLPQECRLTVLSIGNHSKEEFVRTIQQIEETGFRGRRPIRPILESEIPRIAIMNLSGKRFASSLFPAEDDSGDGVDVITKKQKQYVLRMKSRNLESLDACVVKGFNLGMLSMKSHVIADLLNTLVEVPCYETLRTQEQLGYYVKSYVFRDGGVQFFVFSVEGCDHTPSHIHERIDAFVRSFESNLNELSDDDIATSAEELRLVYLMKSKTLQIELGEFWDEIVHSQYRFRRHKELIALIPSITKSDVVEFYQELFVSAVTASSFSLEVFPKSEWEEIEENKNQEYFYVTPSDVHQFKRSLPTYPAVYS